MEMIVREIKHFDKDGLKEIQEIHTTWHEVRSVRNQELKRTDFWALKDLTMNQAKKDYRIFLRELPQNYETADEAADAWNEYEKPE